MFNVWENNSLGSIPAYLGPPVYLNGKPTVARGTVQMWPGGPPVYQEPGPPQYAGDDPPAPGGNPPPLVLPTAFRGQSLTTCLQYLEKYRRVYGRDPVGLWCIGQTPPNTTDKPPRVIHPMPPSHVPPVVVNPPVVLPPSTPPTLSTGPMWRRRPWARIKHRRPVLQPRAVPRATAAAPIAPAELCPARGWVSRAIPGVNEYRTVACTPGQAVVIDQGLATAVRQGALARAGLGDLADGMSLLRDGFTVGGIIIPTWALAAGAGVVAFMLLKKKGR